MKILIEHIKENEFLNQHYKITVNDGEPELRANYIDMITLLAEKQNVRIDEIVYSPLYEEKKPKKKKKKLSTVLFCVGVFFLGCIFTIILKENHELTKGYLEHYKATEVDLLINDKENIIDSLKCELNRQKLKYNALLDEDFGEIAKLVNEKCKQ